MRLELSRQDFIILLAKYYTPQGTQANFIYIYIYKFLKKSKVVFKKFFFKNKLVKLKNNIR